MTYDFTTIQKRFHTGSGKWDELLKYGLTEDTQIIPFSVADMEFRTAPEIVSAIKTALDSTVLGYANPTPEYLDAVCEWMRTRQNWDAKPEWILNTHGVVDAFFAAVRAFTQEGDGVMLMTPVYYPMYMAVDFTHRKLVDCPLVNTGTSYSIDFAEFERLASDPNTKMLILCSPHNPTGRVWTREELTRIGNICLKNHVLVVSDEIHSDLIMPGHAHTVFAGISPEFAEKCLVLTAPSKTFNIAGLQTSNIFIPNPELLAKYFAELKCSNPNPKCNILGYAAAEAAYRHCGAWLDECLKVIDRNRKIISEFMAREFPQVKVHELEGTYLVWLDMTGLGIDFHELERVNREEAGLFFDEGYIFGKQGECFERWNIACPEKYIHEALGRMKEVYSRHVQ